MEIPEGFILGAATSAFQIEGATRVDGRGPSIWDVFPVPDTDNGKVACDHYHRYTDDVALMAELGLDAYRFSISWPRIFPEGRGQVNQKGLDFYSRLVDNLLENDIQPWATLYHWDLPLALQEDGGGWLNRETVNRFEVYAETVASALGDRVGNWFTINEPWTTTVLGYQTGIHAPGLEESVASTLKALHHLLLAHGKSVQRIQARKGNKAGIVLNPWVPLPLRETPEDLEAAEQAWNDQVSWWFEPLYRGSYPQNNPQADFSHVREGDLACISQATDHLGLNMYFPGFITARSKEKGGYEDRSSSIHLPRTEMGWPHYPAALGYLLREVARRYSPSAIYVTENGCASPDLITDEGEVHDLFRQQYIRSHLVETLWAVGDGVPVKGYFAWSLMDNFEWDRGYGKRFGLYYVNYDTLERLPKRSARWYARVCRARKLVGEPSPGDLKR